MHRYTLTMVAAALVLTTGVLLPNVASATPLSQSAGLRLGLDDMNPIQDIAICFYVDGWNGPGLYECGYRRRQGQGWHSARDEHHDQGRRNDRDRDHRNDNYGRYNSGERRER
jgi:hypothetical protein